MLVIMFQCGKPAEIGTCVHVYDRIRQPSALVAGLALPCKSNKKKEMKQQIKRISKGEKIFTILMGIVIGVIIVVHVLRDINTI